MLLEIPLQSCNVQYFHRCRMNIMPDIIQVHVVAPSQNPHVLPRIQIFSSFSSFFLSITLGHFFFKFVFNHKISATIFLTGNFLNAADRDGLHGSLLDPILLSASDNTRLGWSRYECLERYSYLISPWIIQRALGEFRHMARREALACKEKGEFYCSEPSSWSWRIYHTHMILTDRGKRWGSNESPLGACPT